MLRIATCGLSILFAFAPAALAVDGTVLINQSTVTNGLPNCFNGGHFPIVICQSGSYRLSGNITLPDASTDGIVVSADHVTIDLNGFSISGPVVCSGSPVTSCSPQGLSFGIGSSNANVVVLNGDIHGIGGFAIDLNIDSRIENVHVANNGFGGIRVGPASKVTNCSVNRNLFDGIVTTQGGATIIGNTVSGNGRLGINAVCISLIQSNLATSNAGGNISGVGPGCVLVNNAAP